MAAVRSDEANANYMGKRREILKLPAGRFLKDIILLN